MTMQYPTYSDQEFANKIALGAGKLLVSTAKPKLLHGPILGDLGDKIAQEWLNAVITKHRPADAILSEEAPDNLTRLSASRVWIIDPLDGTQEYLSHSPDWGVHIALWERLLPLLGTVYLPMTQELFSSSTITTALTHPLTGLAVVSRSKRNQIGLEIAKAAGLSVNFRGAAGVKAMLVVKGEADAYIHAGGQYEWDSCAPVAIAQAAGLHCSRLDGSPLRYNQADPYLPDLLICRPELSESLISQGKDFLKENKK